MKSVRKTINIILLSLTVALAAAVLLLFRPAGRAAPEENDIRFGVFEDRQLVLARVPGCPEVLMVEDGGGAHIFTVTVRNSIVDTRYRNGRLAFRDTVTGREGYFAPDGTITVCEEKEAEPAGESVAPAAPREWETTAVAISTKIEDADPRKMTGGHPFRDEAAKVLSGRLEETDSLRRRKILNYCEHFRTAYTTRDIDFLRQVFSDDALIIVGNVVNAGKASPGLVPAKKAVYSTYTKAEYLRRLARIFENNAKIDVRFSDFRIMRHPTAEGIYGVSLRQKYANDRYSDDGLLFLLWDFRNESMPVIHVRTWQAADAVRDEDDAVSIEDFNLE